MESLNEYMKETLDEFTLEFMDFFFKSWRKFSSNPCMFCRMASNGSFERIPGSLFNGIPGENFQTDLWIFLKFKGKYVTEDLDKFPNEFLEEFLKVF